MQVLTIIKKEEADFISLTDMVKGFEDGLVLIEKWIAKTGRYASGTYAHKDIAFELSSWLSPEFKMYLIIEFQRLKEDESDRLKLEWNLQRTLSKVNYHIHTDTIKEKLIPPTLTKKQINYSSFACLYVILFIGL